MKINLALLRMVGVTIKVLFTFRNIVNYFTERVSKVFCCSLDIAKAFDQINHDALMKTMLQRGRPYYVVRMFLNW